MKKRALTPSIVDNTATKYACSLQILYASVIVVTAWINGFNQFPQWRMLLWRVTFVIVIVSVSALLLRKWARHHYKIKENNLTKHTRCVPCAFVLFFAAFLSGPLHIALNGWTRYEDEYIIATEGISLVFPLCILLLFWSNARISPSR